MEQGLRLAWQGLPWICAVMALGCLAYCLRAGWRRLLIDYVPTSKTSSVSVGHVELKGSAEAAEPLKSQFTATPCVWFRVTVEEQQSAFRNDDRNWVTRVATQEMPFLLKDDRGSLRIDPAGATIQPEVVFDARSMNPSVNRSSLIRSSVPSNLRVIKEEVIRLRSRIFVVGQVRPRLGGATAEIAYSPDAAIFLISAYTEDAVSRRLRLRFWGAGLLGLALLFFGLYLREAALDGRFPATMGIARAAVLYGALWLAAWLAMMCNSLIDLRQRVRKAWAGIDVELRRRADLLPQLDRIVTALLEHEQKVLPLIAALRAQGGATAPGQAGPDPIAVAGPLKVVAEAYPALKSQALFLSLQKQLADTEDRIALARLFFNDTATFFNTRLGLFPDGMLAGVLGMKAQALMNEAGFVHVPTAVKVPGADTAGACPNCKADVRSRSGLKHCPFCGSEQLVPPSNGVPGSCRACGGYQKPIGPNDDRLLGNVLYCGACGFRLVQ